MRVNTVKKIPAAFACALFMFLASCSASSSGEFVTVQGGKFMLNGNEFRFAGTNNYYMHYSTDKMVTDVLDDAQKMGVTVLRCWGFQFGPNTDHNSHGMDTPGVFGVPEKYKAENKKTPEQFGYPRDVFERLDFTVAEAAKRNIRLVIAMNNYWDAFGGIMNASTWQEWFGLKNPEDFYTDSGCKKTYKEFIEFLVTRKNSYTGIPYNEDPTIMTWELMNEPRNPKDKSGRTVKAWVTEMSAFVKKLAPNQLCAVGDEGFMKRQGFVPYAGEGEFCYNGHEGTDFDSLLRIKTVDYGTFHLYPETWGIAESAQMNWGDEYIKKHAESGRAAKKPVVLEEYGTSSAGKLNRMAAYDVWNSTAYNEGLAGSMFWILTSSNTYELAEGGDGIYDDYDGFRIRNDGSPVSALLADYASLFSGSGSPRYLSEPRVYLLNPACAQDAKGVFEISAKFMGGSDSSLKVKRAELYINDAPAASPRTLNYNAASDSYRIKFDTLANAKVFPDGTVLSVKVVFSLSDGSSLETESNQITISNKVTYSVIKHYDFADGIENASSMGAYMAEIKSIRHTKLNGGMVEVDSSCSGENSWEELKVKFGDMKEVADASKMDFTFYYEKDKAVAHASKKNEEEKLPGVQPYVAFDPGWVKTGLKENNCLLENLPVVTLDDGKQYYKVSVSLEFFQNPAYTFVTVCPTLGYVKYSGPVYIDDIVLYKKD
ncbi:cellulase family glycosylhydrolase [Treponema sp.]|uniref:cellulase family glycosylhydrolase n=1 Tax=Treponema sp. TaxID=166 RepID=UPI003EFF9A39